MRALVTGAAGFIGSHVTDALLNEGHRVLGVDCFRDYYSRASKEANLAEARRHPAFELAEADLGTADPRDMLDGVDVVFHQAAQPGVRLSWADGFPRYSADNVLATQRLLEAVKASGVDRLVHASSSSVYGNAARYPTTEDVTPQPHSPYGVTKLAAEHLCRAYAANFGTDVVILRYFTVYGPRQRPDMATHRLIEAASGGPPFELFGTGEAVRDFTYVGDVVRANLAAAVADVAPGTVCNIAGGASCTVADLVAAAEAAVGHPVAVVRCDPQPGDVQRTGGNSHLARKLLGWEPATDLQDGLRAQVAWHHRTVLEDGKQHR